VSLDSSHVARGPPRIKRIERIELFQKLFNPEVTVYAFYAFYAWWFHFPQSGALAEGTSVTVTVTVYLFLRFALCQLEYLK
jgi:hypothetical protein